MSAKTVTGLLFVLSGFLSSAVWAQSETQPPSKLTLSLAQAVTLALSPEGNVRVQLADEKIRQAKAQSGQARAALLPDFEGTLSVQDKTFALGTIGLTLIRGLNVPHLIGPFTHSDARASVHENLLDLTRIRQFQASHANISATKAEDKSTRDQIAAQVARFYFAALRADASLETSQADVTLAEALFQQAHNRLAAGTGIEMDETRARVQLAQDRQRLIAAETNRKHAYLELLKSLNLKLDAPVELRGKLERGPVAFADPEQALAVAVKSRSDLIAQQEREEVSRWNDRAERMEHAPSVQAFADYGSASIGTTTSVPTRTVGVVIHVPVFDGGGREARRAETQSLLRQEILRGKDLRKTVDLQIRSAFEDLHSAEQQISAAEEAVSLAERELQQARRRYDNGVVSSIEVTDAETRLAAARQSRIEAIYLYNLARVDLNEATGTIENVVGEKKG